MVRRVGVVVIAMILLAGCRWDGDDGRDHNPDNQPAYARPSATRAPADGSARDRRPGPDRHVVRGPSARPQQASLHLVNGSDVVRVRVAELGDTLFEISTPERSKAAPVVDVDDTTVIVGLRDTGLSGPAVVTAVLDDDVRWTVRLGGGASDEVVDLTGGPGGDVDLTAGTSRAEVTLPAGRGTQRVTMSGGAGQFSVRLAGNAPVRVAAMGGANSVTIDGETHTGIPGGSMWTPDNWAAATDRYDVNATAGVSTMTVART